MMMMASTHCSSFKKNWDIWDDDDDAYGDDDDDGEHTLQQLHFRECPRYATASQAAWPPLTETATECSHYKINHDEDGKDENGGGYYFNQEGIQIATQV